MRTKLLILTLAAGALLPAQSDMVETLMSFDKDKDGKLTKEEVPERMQGIFARADADRDGFLTKEELQKATAGMERGGERRGPGGPGGMMMMSPLMRALDTDKDGALSAAEIAAAPTTLKTLDKDGDGILSAEELRPPMRGGEGRRRE